MTEMTGLAKRILCAAVFAAVTSAGLQTAPVRIHAAAENEGLVKEDGHYCYYEDGQPVTDSWITVEEGTFYFDGDGKASVLSCSIEGDYYVFDGEGRLMQPSGTRIVKVEAEDGQTKKYYVDSDGMAVSGWSDDKKYYFDKTGAMVTGITVIKEKFYCFQANGRYNQAKTQKIRKTARYEKPFSDLQKFIGKPKKAKYYASCYGKGRDGILTYDGYKVYTFKPDRGAEIFMGAE